MALPVFDAASADDDPTSSTVGVDHTGTGSNLGALIGVFWKNITATLSTVKYGGIDASFLARVATSTYTTELWFAVGIPTGLQSVIANSVGGTMTLPVVGVCTYTGVNQATPTGTPNSAAHASGTPPSLLIDSTVEQLIVDFLGVPANRNCTVSQANQVERLEYDEGNSTIAFSERPGLVSSTTLGWTLSSASSSKQIGVALNGIAAGGDIDGEFAKNIPHLTGQLFGNVATPAIIRSERFRTRAIQISVDRSSRW